MKRTLVVIVFLILVAPTLRAETADKWQFQITPYLWLPTIDGTLNYAPPPGGGGAPEISVGPTDWLKLINAGLLLNAGAKKGRLSIFTDIVYLSMQNNNDGRVTSVDGNIPAGPITIPVSADITLNTQSDLDGLVWTLAAGYTVNETESSVTDIFAGVRILNISASSSWNLTADITTPGGTQVLAAQGAIARSTDLTDGIIGVRGHFDVGDSKKWSAQYSLDIGAGSSELTWNAVFGLSRTYGWGDLMLSYRHLEYDEDGSGLLQNFSFSGPGIGARFKF
jgi:hypothetical protein